MVGLFNADHRSIIDQLWRASFAAVGNVRMIESLTRPADLPPILWEDLLPLLDRYAEVADGSVIAPDVIAAFAKSPFIAEYAIREPQAFAQMLADPALPRPRTVADYAAEIDRLLTQSTDMAAAQRALRRFRRSEFTRIAWRDLMQDVDVVTIMGELSSCADAIIAAAVRWLHGQAAARLGRALDRDGAPLELLVLGMGKLGGRELNFSSDIDLIFVYEDPGTTVGGRKELDHQDYFDRIGRDFIALLNETTVDGFVFRVDMRLRPFGDSGPLTSSLGALEHYYSVHGRDWERYALIKARALSGGPRLQAGLAALVRPFIYRRYLDYGALDALRDMKASINREANTRELQDDVKRGTGGIREIEFTAQLFQLTRGGREARLRDRSLLTTLQACAELGLLSADDVSSLSGAYRFLRTTEHRLQEVHDEQTHRIPREASGRARLAYASGDPDWPTFAARLDAARTATSRRFAELLAPAVVAGDGAASDRSPWQDVWSGAEERDRIEVRLAAAGIAADEAIVDVIVELKAPRFANRLSRTGRDRLDRLMPGLLETMQRSAMSPPAQRRLGELIHAIARRSVYLAFLIDNPGAVKRLIELFDASPWIADQITRYPILLDELLDPGVLYSPPDQVRLAELARQQVVVADDLESAMEALRAFKNQQVLRVAASDITGQFPVAEVSNQLTHIAEASVAAALALAWRDLAARFGEPRCVDDRGVERRACLTVIGYGKLGGWELGYGSDLDLVFVHDSAGQTQQTSGPRVIENNVFFTRLVQRLIHILSTATPSGAAYEVDTRLRPNGAAGQLVTSLDALASYLRDEAWVWEQQALVRARAVAGDRTLGSQFSALRGAVLARPRELAELEAEITGMRQRMLAEHDRAGPGRFDLKHGLGGITDIEFMVQYAVLRWACEHPQLLVWSDNLRTLEIIAELGLWKTGTCSTLHDAYFAMRAEIHRSTLQQADGVVDAAGFEQHRARVRAIWNSVFA